MSALLYWTCGKEMADMLLANGDAKEAEKLIRSQMNQTIMKFLITRDAMKTASLLILKLVS